MIVPLGPLIFKLILVGLTAIWCGWVSLLAILHVAEWWVGRQNAEKERVDEKSLDLTPTKPSQPSALSSAQSDSEYVVVNGLRRKKYSWERKLERDIKKLQEKLDE